MKPPLRIIRVLIEGVIGFGALIFVWKIAAGAGRLSLIERVAGLLFFGSGALVMLLYLVEQQRGLTVQLRQGTIAPWKKSTLGLCGIAMGVGTALFGQPNRVDIIDWLVYLAGPVFFGGGGLFLLFKKGKGTVR